MSECKYLVAFVAMVVTVMACVAILGVSKQSHDRIYTCQEVLKGELIFNPTTNMYSCEKIGGY
jgi:hypothetical protein